MAPQHSEPPPPREPAEELEGLLRAFDGRRVVFIDSAGAWREDPVSLVDRTVHNLLFRLSVVPGENQEPPVRLLERFLTPERRTALALLAEGRPALPAAAVLVRGLGRLLQAEVLRHQAFSGVQAWDQEGKKFRQEADALLAEEEVRLIGLLGAETRRRLAGALAGDDPAADMLRSLVRLVADEDRLLAEVGSLRRLMSETARAEEAAGRILEKLLPPQGIVTHVTPALLLPCLRLLADGSCGLETGIPYTASVILSILRDPRSTAGLLRALDHLPLSCSKVRENIIYTLGCLGEERAAPPLIAVLEKEDEVVCGQPSEGQGVRLLVEQKTEAAWALGKIGAAAVPAIPALARCADHGSPALRTAAAWTLGEVGRAQKETSGGLDADVVIALLKLLKARDRQVFEEAVCALRKIDLPEFVHSLYLYHAGAVSLQGLLPAQRGLYELSETLHYLIQSKGRAIMAVTGDSGTGKTYFCHSIARGFGDIRAQDILYLMRDRKSGQNVFNRLLGLRWLKKNIDPAYYHDYPLTEDQDDPRGFMERFLEDNRHKKLIILDGCRDRDYFQRVIDTFYERNVLDVDVTFRATFSTRRMNLEEREMALESVKTHLSFLEEPVLEDTPFYREGIVLLYDFDNSRGSRLGREETLELFDRRRIDSWGELIRLGTFDRGRRALPVSDSPIDLLSGSAEPQVAALPAGRSRSFRQEERHVRIHLNEDPAREPNLLLTLELGDLAADRLRFYAQNQVAGTSSEGRAFVLSFIDNRLFIARREGAAGLALLGRDLAVLSRQGDLDLISFERGETTALGRAPNAPPARCLCSSGKNAVVTGHEDGTLVIWDLEEGKARRFRLSPAAVCALACDRHGRVCAGTSDGRLFRLDPPAGRLETIEVPGRTASLIKPFLRGRVLAVTEAASPEGAERGSRVHIFDLDARTSRTIAPEPGCRVTAVSVDYDGRIITGLDDGRLLILDAGKDPVSCSHLEGHGRSTRDCLTMGPKIISCGLEDTGRPALRVWGTELYVRTELGKQAVRMAWPSSFR